MAPIRTAEQQENIRKFVAELRTTTKTQGQRNLIRHLDDGTTEYCCLGIACEVAIANGLDLERGVYRYEDGLTVDQFRNNPGGVFVDAVLPETVVHFYGFGATDPGLLEEDGTVSTAITLNDENNYNFNQIAAAFERTYPDDS